MLVVSQDEGSFGDQQWFLCASHIQGVDLSRDIILYFLFFLCIGDNCTLFCCGGLNGLCVIGRSLSNT